jgi:ubiquinone biosynthesis accessory factor UbiJ
MPATPPWLAAAEAMFNRNIDASSQAAMLAQRLNGTSLQIDVEGLTRVRALLQGGRLSLLAGDDSPADAVISGAPSALWSLLRTGAPARTPPRGAAPRAAAQIRGDAEIANLYKEFFTATRPDPEEELSRWFGDLPARQGMRFAAGLRTWLERTRRVAGENIAEYLQEESRDVPSRTEAEEFLAGVDAAREATDRLEARIKGLERRLREAD